MPINQQIFYLSYWKFASCVVVTCINQTRDTKSVWNTHEPSTYWRIIWNYMNMKMWKSLTSNSCTMNFLFVAIFGVDIFLSPPVVFPIILWFVLWITSMLDRCGLVWCFTSIYNSAWLYLLGKIWFIYFEMLWGFVCWIFQHERLTFLCKGFNLMLWILAMQIGNYKQQWKPSSFFDFGILEKLQYWKWILYTGCPAVKSIYRKTSCSWVVFVLADLIYLVQ